MTVSAGNGLGSDPREKCMDEQEMWAVYGLPACSAAAEACRVTRADGTARESIWRYAPEEAAWMALHDGRDPVAAATRACRGETLGPGPLKVPPYVPPATAPWTPRLEALEKRRRDRHAPGVSW